AGRTPLASTRAASAPRTLGSGTVRGVSARWAANISDSSTASTSDGAGARSNSGWSAGAGLPAARGRGTGAGAVASGAAGATSTGADHQAGYGSGGSGFQVRGAAAPRWRKASTGTVISAREAPPWEPARPGW